MEPMHTPSAMHACIACTGQNWCAEGIGLRRVPAPPYMGDELDAAQTGVSKDRDMPSTVEVAFGSTPNGAEGGCDTVDHWQ